MNNINCLFICLLKMSENVSTTISSGLPDFNWSGLSEHDMSSMFFSKEQPTDGVLKEIAEIRLVKLKIYSNLQDAYRKKELTSKQMDIYGCGEPYWTEHQKAVAEWCRIGAEESKLSGLLLDLYQQARCLTKNNK